MLYICATPIGNLEDITLRALRVLKECDAILCEDTRHSAGLFFKYEINKPLISYHEHNEQSRTEQVLERLKNGENLVLVTDAGMPCISDPGYILVARCREEGLPVTVLPGANAGICALVLSGMKCDRFVFEGFLPRVAKERKERLAALKNEKRAVILHESPHHLEKTLEELYDAIGERTVAVAREMTKVHEECLIFPLSAWREQVQNVKGEFVLVLGPVEETAEEVADERPLREQVAELMQTGMEKKEAIKAVAKRNNLTKNDVYQETMDL